MCGQGSEQWPNIRQEFKARLKKEWTRKVDCQRQCDPPESCTCQRHFIDVEKLESWMNRQDTEEAPNTKAGRLLAELHDKIKHHSAFGLPLDSTPIFTGEHRSVRMFSMLLDQERGDLIDIFHSARMCDKYLDLSEDQYKAHHPNLRKKLREKGIGDAVIDDIIETVERERWAYCCPINHFTLHMNASFEGGKVIMPFCRRMRINNKGGTAEVFWVAIQEDLIVDQKLRDALEKSAYTDPEFGRCYQMALKSYRVARKDIFDWEKEAFSGLKNDPKIPIVRYLGSYSHDDGETGTLGKTYNLLLEFGERDLEEYCADLTNVPPVRSCEIIRFWESLFKVAAAIEKIHNLSIMQGRKVMNYHGWHADIKPDNILRVHGDFKLADFGFSRFSEKVGRDSSPKQYIEGGTDTYGAPEFARMKLSGTRSEVTQSIDTWSFGCVLSVAATWVVLGYQGVLQYQKLREQAPSNRTVEGKPTDRFHDCNQVLPEIKRWHNFLRGHVRTADTATTLVLDLIELHMLQKETQDRYEFKDLCKKLTELIKRAERNCDELPSHARETDGSVKRALLAMEKEAEDRTSDVNATPLQREFRLSEMSLQRKGVDPSYRASMRFKKDEVLNDIPRAQIPYRKELLEQELDDGLVFGQDQGSPAAAGFHKGATTDSPTDTSPTLGPQSTFPRRAAPRKPPKIQTGLGITEEAVENDPPLQRNTPVPQIREPSPTSTTSQPRRSHFSSISLKSHDKETDPGDLSRDITFGSASDKFSTSAFCTHIEASASRNVPINDKDRKANVPTSQSPISAIDTNIGHTGSDFYSVQSLDKAPSASVFEDSTAQSTSSIHRDQSDNDLGQPRDSAVDEGNGRSHSIPLVSLASTAMPYTINKGQSKVSQEENDTSYSPNDNPTKSPEYPTSVPDITVQGPHNGPTLKLEQAPSRGRPHSAVERSVRENRAEQTASPTTSLPQETLALQIQSELPPNVYNLPWDICRIRGLLEERLPKGMADRVRARFTNWIPKEHRMDDFYRYLSTWIDNRDMVLVIDNGSTMHKHWGIASFVAETLAMQLSGLDDDGVDTIFTIRGKDHNVTKLKGLKGLEKLHKVLDAARPKAPGDQVYATDLADVMDNITRTYRKQKQLKATTLLILTDGEWQGTKMEHLYKVITDFAGHVQSSSPARHFSITFIRFGDLDIAVDRMEYLDDKLCADHGLSDIIDSCTWKDKVDKMLLGSVTEFQDQEGQADAVQSSKSPLINYDEDGLNGLFDAFNNKSSAPIPSSRRSPNSSSVDLHPPNRTDTGVTVRSRLSKETARKRSSWIG